MNGKLPQIGNSIFSIMSTLATQHGAINLSQGFPDFDCPDELKKLVKLAIDSGHNQYAPMPGLMSLREKIAVKTEDLYSAIYNPETEITIVPGATLGIFAAMSALVRENDEVIVIEPAYDSYIPAIELAGGKAIVYEMQFPDYKVDWEQVKKLISIRTRMIVINTPHNPSGATLSSEDMRKLEKLITNTDVIVLSDEVYEHIIFDGLEHQSIARYPKLANRSVIISSFGKTYHTTGWKMGYVLAPENLTSAIRKSYQFMAFAANTPIQHAYAGILEHKDLYLELGAFYQAKRDLFRKGLKSSKFKLFNCNGSYFQALSYEKLEDSALSDQEMARKLTIEKGIASIPFSSFYMRKTDNKVLRFCFAKSEDTLNRALEVLCKI
ncbi:MAG: aminotransferase class I/II-fold pyridoxal phosphate-dependent enzyme [Bacteroidia bacterium]|nr:aminotransferase class I/II-fold pyridoxal phosphate-dependent enzyme [Bacteroidia bacterium]